MSFESDAEKLGVLSDMESVITEFCKRTGLKYDPSRRWIDILRHLASLSLTRQDLYHFFVAITERYAVWNVKLVNAASTLFRLLILYHEPELCSFFDTKKIDISKFLQPWILSVFGDGVPNTDTLLTLWDSYFLQADTFFVFFLSFVVVLNLKEQFLGEWKSVDRDEIVSHIQQALSELAVEDIPDFFQLSLHYASQTPASFRNDYSFLFFDSTTHQRDGQCTSDSKGQDISKLDTALCLQLSVPELMQSLQLSGALRFFVVDCRPADQYNFGHLNGSVHLDATLLLDDPPAYNTAVAAVIDLQQSRVTHDCDEETANGMGPNHICFVGSGRDEEDRVVNMVIANFLQRQMKRVSVLRGGFAAVHKASVGNLDEAIADHDEKHCMVCLDQLAGNDTVKDNRSNSSASQSTDAKSDGSWHNTMSFMKGFGSSIKSRFGEVTKNLAAASNAEGGPTAKAGSFLPINVPHLIGKGSKAYRKPQDVFADDEEDNREEAETVNISGFTNRSDVKHSFNCKLLDKRDELHPACLVITSTHVFILRQLEDVPEMAFVHSRKKFVTW